MNRKYRNPFENVWFNSEKSDKLIDLGESVVGWWVVVMPVAKMVH